MDFITFSSMVFGAVAILALTFILRGRKGVSELAGDALRAAIVAAQGVLRVKLRDYVAKAESLSGKGTGQLKLAQVLDMITESAYYNGLPQEVRDALDARELVELIDMTVRDWLTPQINKNPDMRALITN